MRRGLLAFVAVSAMLVAVVGRDGRAALALAPDVSAAQTTLTWKSCQPSGFQCATLTVPVDYTRPSGATLSLALIRLPAKHQSQRIGSLLANPGGPGGSAIEFMKAWANVVSSDIHNRFDLVAFDPRGVGLSTPIVCHDTLQKLVALDPSPDNAAEWTQAETVSKKFADDCAAKYPNLLPYLGTKNVVRDMESIRVALGEDKITYVGYSYGTAIGAVYADMYPTHVRAFVLDGALDLSQDFEQSSGSQIGGFERAFQSYLANCRATHCALAANGDPEAAVDTLMAQVELTPIPSSADRPAGPGETLTGILGALYSQREWASLTQALTDAIDGDGTGLVDLTDQYLERKQDGSYPNLMEAFNAVSFDDATCPKDPNSYIALVPQFTKLSKHFGPSAAEAGLLCAYWQTTPDQLTTPRAAGAPPIVVISTTNDPATPYEQGVALSKQLESGHLITHRGEGHTIYAQGDSCVDAAVNAYLINLTTPADGLTCGNGAPPPETEQTPAASGSATPSTAAPSPTRTGATPSSSSGTPTAPGVPNTGGPASGKGSGAGNVAILAVLFVLVALAGAGVIVVLQRRERF
jgi:pimeloyl-ACP methyl ester carboxylesterase